MLLYKAAQLRLVLLQSSARCTAAVHGFLLHHIVIVERLVGVRLCRSRNRCICTILVLWQYCRQLHGVSSDTAEMRTQRQANNVLHSSVSWNHA